MELWTWWTDALTLGIQSLCGHFGLSEAAAIIVFTFAARIVMTPLSLAAGYRALGNRLAMERIRPAVERLRERFKDNPQELAARTLALHRENGIRFFGGPTLCNIGAQSALGFGLYQALRRLAPHSNFLWIANLAKPDLLLAVLAGAIMCVSMLTMPGAESQTSLILVVVPVLIGVMSLAFAPSALGIYWIASNLYGAAHNLVLRSLVRKYPPQARI